MRNRIAQRALASLWERREGLSCDNDDTIRDTTLRLAEHTATAGIEGLDDQVVAGCLEALPTEQQSGLLCFYLIDNLDVNVSVGVTLASVSLDQAAQAGGLSDTMRDVGIHCGGCPPESPGVPRRDPLRRSKKTKPMTPARDMSSRCLLTSADPELHPRGSVLASVHGL